MSLPVDLNTITVTASYPNIAGQPQSGSVTFDPGQVVADSAGQVILTGAVTRQVWNGKMQPVILPCTDNAGLNPTGFAYTVTEVIGDSKRSYQVVLPHTLGASVDLSSLSPVTQPPNVNTFSGNNTWSGGNTFSGEVAFTEGAAADFVWTCVDTTGLGEWAPATGGGGSGLINPMTSIGDMIYGAAAGVGTRLAAQTAASKKFLTETGTGAAGQAPAWSVIVAADVPTLNQNTTGTAGNVTATLDLVPAPAANVALAGHKITGLANGTVSSDAAAFGQVPVSASTIGGLLAASNLSDVANAATARTNLGLGSAATQASSAFDASGAATTAQVNAEAYTDAETSRAEAAEALKLAKASNLSDLGNAATARTNLGLGSAATQASSVFAQVANNLSDLASPSTARTNLGLGSAAIQPSSVFAQVANNLSDLPSATTARTNLGLGTAATHAAGDFAQTTNNLSDLASASTARTNLGLGSAATHAATDFLATAGGTLTGWLAPAVATLTFGSTIAVNAALGNSFAVTLTSSAGTLSNPTNPVDGQTVRVRVIQDGTGSRTLAYGTAYDFGAAGSPTLSTGANKVDILGFEYVASLSKWCYLGSGLGF